MIDEVIVDGKGCKTELDVAMAEVFFGCVSIYIMFKGCTV